MSAPTITSVYPDNVPAGGGVMVTIIGTDLTGATVTVGGTSPISTTVTGSTKIEIFIDQKIEGSYDVVVTTGSGSATRTNGLRYLGSTSISGYQRNRVREVATVTGTGAIGLSGASSSSHTRFQTVCLNNTPVRYMIVNSNGEYEVGIGRFVDDINGGGITREFVEQSSNSNTLVSFSAGTKEIILCETSGYSEVTAEYRNILDNASLELWQRQTPGTEKSLADGEYGPDRWYVLTQSANIGAYRATAGRPYIHEASGAILKQTNATAQRFGIAQRVWSRDSIGLRGKLCRIQAGFASNKSSGAQVEIRWAVLGWTGTADSVTRDPVLSWTSTTYTPGNFFLASNYEVAGTGSLVIPTGVDSGAISSITTTPFSYSVNNIVVMFWTKDTLAQNQTLTFFTPMLIDDVHPRRWKKPNSTLELLKCQASYCKTFATDTAPAQNAGTSGAIAISTPVASRLCVVPWVFPVEMMKEPVVTTFNPSATNANWRDRTNAVDITNSTQLSGPKRVRFVVLPTNLSDDTVIHATADADQ